MIPNLPRAVINALPTVRPAKLEIGQAYYLQPPDLPHLVTIWDYTGARYTVDFRSLEEIKLHVFIGRPASTFVGLIADDEGFADLRGSPILVRLCTERTGAVAARKAQTEREGL